jgi:hypothetical protein
MDVTCLVQVIKPRIAIGRVRKPEIVSVSAILDRTFEATIGKWRERAGMNKLLMSINH